VYEVLIVNDEQATVVPSELLMAGLLDVTVLFVFEAVTYLVLKTLVVQSVEIA
jgi:hypothetical protein